MVESFAEIFSLKNFNPSLQGPGGALYRGKVSIAFSISSSKKDTESSASCVVETVGRHKEERND